MGGPPPQVRDRQHNDRCVAPRAPPAARGTLAALDEIAVEVRSQVVRPAPRHPNRILRRTREARRRGIGRLRGGLLRQPGEPREGEQDEESGGAEAAGLARGAALPAGPQRMGRGGRARNRAPGVRATLRDGADPNPPNVQGSVRCPVPKRQANPRGRCSGMERRPRCAGPRHRCTRHRGPGIRLRACGLHGRVESRERGRERYRSALRRPRRLRAAVRPPCPSGCVDCNIRCSREDATTEPWGGSTTAPCLRLLLTGPRVRPALGLDLGPGQRLCPRGAMRVAPASPSFSGQW